MTIPRIVVAALRGGAGKTVVSLGLARCLSKDGMNLAPFKKGPDFIDSRWLTLAAGRTCRNLDTFLVDRQQVVESFCNACQASDLAIIEGNRGLYDGMDLDGRSSTAELAKLLKASVLLVVDCTKTTRTVAATVLGCLHFDPEVQLCGVVLNKVGSARHSAIVKKAIEHYCAIPVLGSVPRVDDYSFPERHMGLVSVDEHPFAEESISRAAALIKAHVDIGHVLNIARSARPLTEARNRQQKIKVTPSTQLSRPKIGVIKDAAFQFYYPENLEALEAQGGELVYISALSGMKFPDDIHALYIGGGFPETHAMLLAENQYFRRQVKKLSIQGLPIYAECGGLMYLCESLVVGGHTYPMAGLFPAVLGLASKPQGHGYTILEMEEESPFFDKGSLIRGHEFRYSTLLEWRGQPSDLAFRMIRGTGFCDKRDGLNFLNTLATYSHIHALGVPTWAKRMVELGRKFWIDSTESPAKKQMV